ncbi:uncharacterized protein PITG_06197 [Phytophthora infestans T30-4]|uniref:No apical meristem-associated C-terminal domain-containing protein n=1 Tax=Phytophthora infestans (strain T30-4) TaxID=403677 RepID=D0N4B0_PHYIT|nr:uncharacterized protein PITG_06197 [Phytophthora infestans T30-4]EEY69718.1 conserved hypothetical protein [Phytophthora infestans T30-4]|eukprot:XP_002998365.1 conserved hypothetical protein [Phytophthora infestans T30-4]
MRGKAARVKRKPTFWDRDGVNDGKSSLQVVLDWLSTETNYNKWRGSDRNSGSTKEALLKEIAAELSAAQNGAGITSESTLRGEILKRCSYYYQITAVFEARPSARPRVTSDDIDDNADASDRGSAIVQRGEMRPLVLDDEVDLKRLKADPVDKLLAQQSKACKLRADKASRMLQLHESELKLKQREVQLKEDRNERESAQADVELALKRVQLEAAQREAVVQLLLARKKLLDAGVSVVKADRLLPPSA